jgi:hypothetical protein
MRQALLAAGALALLGAPSREAAGQAFPALDPPVLERRVPAVPAPPPPEEYVPPSAATVEWTLHRSVDGLHPDGNEQAMLWLMNRARQDPAAEGVFLATSTEPDVAGGRTFFGVNLALLQSEFAALAPKPPAAFDVRLWDAARAHSEDMIARNSQDHLGQFDRVDAAGFRFARIRGNVFAFTDSALEAHAGFNIDWGTGDGTGMQPGRGHRLAIMAVDGDYTNVGLAVVPEANPATSVGPLVVTGNYASALANGVDHFNRFLVGTVWQDGNGNGLYDPGEGLGGVTVQPDRGPFFAVTAAGGGYAIPATEAGEHAVTFTGGALPSAVTRRVTVGEASVLLDHLVGAAVAERPTLTAPASGLVLAPGALLALAWTPVGGAASYLVEYSGPGLAFANPNGTGVDPVNGSGGAGGALVVAGTGANVAVPAVVPPGPYQVRVIGRASSGAFLGTFSDALTVHVGVGPDARPAFTGFPAGALARGGPAALSWTSLTGITRYALEVIGPGRTFAVPNAQSFDPGASALVVPGTALNAVVPPTFAPGSYQVRVFGLTAGDRPVGRASDALTLIVQ